MTHLYVHNTGVHSSDGKVYSNGFTHAKHALGWPDPLLFLSLFYPLLPSLLSLRFPPLLY